MSSLGSQYQAELSGNGSSTEAAGDDGSRSGRMESADANADPVAKSDIMQAHGRALSNDDSGGSNVRSQGTSATGPGRGRSRAGNISEGRQIRTLRRSRRDIVKRSNAPAPSRQSACLPATGRRSAAKCERTGNAMANDRPPAGSEPMPAVSEIAPPALVRQSGEAESAIIQSQGLGDLATANDGQSLRPDRTATPGSGSTSDSSEMPAPRADIRPREEQPESLPRVGTSHMIDVKAQASNETNVQTIGLSVIGQSRSFAPPVTSFQMQQIARPVPGRGQVAPATFRRAGKSNSSTIPAGHREEVNAPAPSRAVSPGIGAGQSDERKSPATPWQTIGLLREANPCPRSPRLLRRHLFGRAARRTLRSSSLRGWATLQRRTMGNRFGRIGPQHSGRARHRISRKCRPRAPIFGRGRSSRNRCRGSALHT